MDYKDVIKSMCSDSPKPIYLLQGEESFFIDEIMKVAEDKLIPAEMKDFNQITFYGKDSDAKSVEDACRRFPMMSPRLVVVLKEAQDMKEFPKLEGYLKKPTDSTIFVIAHKGTLKASHKIMKAAKAETEIFAAKKIYENKIPSWLEGQVKAKKFTIDPEAVELMVQSIGASLPKLSNELEKLIINIPPKSNITKEIVTTNIGISKEYNVFELQKAIANKDIDTLMRITQFFIANPKKNPIQMVISNLYGFLSKSFIGTQFNRVDDMTWCQNIGIYGVNQYSAKFRLADYKSMKKNYSRTQVEEMIFLLRDFDLKSKGVNVGPQTPPEQLLKEMMFKLVSV